MKKSVKVKAISLVLSLALVLSLVTAVSLMTQAQELNVVKSGETKMFYPTTDGYKFGDGTIFLSGSTIQAASGGLAMHVYIDNELVYESPNSSNYTFKQDCQSNSVIVRLFIIVLMSRDLTANRDVLFILIRTPIRQKKLL